MRAYNLHRIPYRTAYSLLLTANCIVRGPVAIQLTVKQLTAGGGQYAVSELQAMNSRQWAVDSEGVKVSSRQ